MRSRVRLSDDEINSKEGGKVGGVAMKVAGKKEEAYISRVGKEVVGDEVAAGFNGDAVAGSNKVGPGSNVGTDSLESVPDVGT